MEQIRSLVTFLVAVSSSATFTLGHLRRISGVSGKSFFSRRIPYVASNLLNMATPLTDFNPTNVVGVITDIYISVVALLTFGIVLNIVNVFQVPIAMNSMIEICVKGNVIVPLIALGFFIPLQIAIVAVVCGSLLALLEGWSVHDGIFYVFSNLLGLGT
jgi:hypothetical protein